MPPERWRKIEELYHAALERGRSVLADADPELRREVESLLAQEEARLPTLQMGEPIAAGARIGVYRIETKLGEGGMGVVYRALDTKLNRTVAIKFLSEELADAAARRRFQREAQTASSLNHPHILTVHDAGEFNGLQYLVTEYVDGGTLKDWARIEKRTWRQLVELMTGVADGLAAAHQTGILHRDIKPDNILVGKNGYAKLADFGLAKLDEGVMLGQGIDRTRTLTEKRTKQGLVIGTIAYMSPEQASGKPLDARSDIFSFGVVLYELQAGQRPFTGVTDLEVLQTIIHGAPRSLGDDTPAALRAVVEKALEKDPGDRYQSMREMVVDLRRLARRSVETALPEVGRGHTLQGAEAGGMRRNKWLWPAVAGGVIAAGAALAILYAPWRKPAPTQAVRFEVGPAGKMTFVEQASMTVSPDGRWMVFPANGEDGVQRYYLRAIDGVEVRPLPGAQGVQTPASWSYDSRWVVFVADNKLRKIDIQGGPPQNIADFPTNRLGGASWNPDGVIIAGTDNSPILRVPASGGKATPLTALAPGESGHRWPQFLPDGKHFLYQRASTDQAKGGVYIGSIDVQPTQQSMQRLLASNRQAYYAPAPGSGAGHLIFLRGATLMAQPFDPSKMVLSGEPEAIAEGIDSYPTTNHGLYSVSETGTLVYRGGSGPQTMLTWFDLQGNPAGTVGDPGNYAWPAISPDGSRVAVAMGSQANRDIWILNVARGGASTRFTFDPARDDTPAWSPDGKNIAFTSNRDGQLDLYIKPADGSREEKLLLKTEEYKILQHWTKDGRFLLFDSIGPMTSQDVWALPFPEAAKPVPLVKTPFIERWARVSPDGHWLAYTSTESDSNEIYVGPFTPDAPPNTGAKFLVSKGGGIRPLWRPDGRELFYVTPNSEVMGVDIDTSKGFQAGAPRRLFTAPPGVVNVSWDLSADGKHFLFVAPPDTGRVVPFTVVLNWAADLKK